MTDEHYEEASRMNNFSGWVRQRLNEYIRDAKNQHGKLTTYKCEKCRSNLGGFEFQKPPITSRAKGVHFPSSTMCPNCGESCLRWDLV